MASRPPRPGGSALSGAPSLREALRRVRDAGGRSFVPYVTAGLAAVEPEVLLGLEAAGAHAIEVGIPFSDPVMDGPVIQEASRRALEAGTNPEEAFALVRDARDAGLGVPVAFMTYLNPILAEGTQRFLRLAAEASASGVIVPDLPVDEAGEWVSACADASVAPVLLAAPNSSTDRLRLIAERSDGFVYCVSTFGVTGSRAALSGSARGVVDALRPLTRTPLLAGVGVSTPEQAGEACGFADGVVVGSALVAPMLDGDLDGMLASARAFSEAVATAGTAGAG
jgi:tryptophan synthase alpha chain